MSLMCLFVAYVCRWAGAKKIVKVLKIVVAMVIVDD